MGADRVQLDPVTSRMFRTAPYGFMASLRLIGCILSGYMRSEGEDGGDWEKYKEGFVSARRGKRTMCTLAHRLSLSMVQVGPGAVSRLRVLVVWYEGRRGRRCGEP